MRMPGLNSQRVFCGVSMMGVPIVKNLPLSITGGSWEVGVPDTVSAPREMREVICETGGGVRDIGMPFILRAPRRIDVEGICTFAGAAPSSIVRLNDESSCKSVIAARNRSMEALSGNTVVVPLKL